MIYHLDGDAAGGGDGDGAGGVAVEGIPGVGVDFGAEGGFQGFVGIVLTEEVGVADEETLAVVVGVDEPAGDAVGVVAAHFAGAGIEDVHAVDLHPDVAVCVRIEYVDVGLAENDEEVADAGALEVFGHV